MVHMHSEDKLIARCLTMKATNQIYFIISFFLTLLISFLLIFRNSSVAFLLVLIAGGAVGLYILYRFVIFPQTLRYMAILGESLLFAYSLGTLGTVASVLFAKSSTMEATIGCGQEALSSALILVLSACALLFFFATFERPIFHGFSLFSASASGERIIWAGVIVIFSAFVYGDLGYMGIITGENQRVSVLGSIAWHINAPLLAFTTFSILRSKGYRKKAMLSTCLLIFLIALLPQGRRVFLYAVMVAAIALSLGGVHLRKSPKMALLLVLIAGGLVYISFDFFFALRYAIRSLGSNYDLGHYVLQSLQMLSGEQHRTVQTLLLENIQRRSSFLIYYLSLLLSASWHHSFLLGENLLLSIKKTVPSAFYPGKTSVLPEMMEALVNPHFALPATDMANSILTAGVSDFGIAGGLLYPILLGITYIAFDRMIVRRFPKPLRLFLMLSMTYSLFQAEQTLVGYFVTLRNLLLIIPLFFVLIRLPRFNSRRRELIQVGKGTNKILIDSCRKVHSQLRNDCLSDT